MEDGSIFYGLGSAVLKTAWLFYSIA
jgi:hypothetical protein